LGQKTSLGRHFFPEESQVGNDHVVILNRPFWQQHFGSDPDIVGKKLRMSGESYTVVGVAAPGPNDHGDSQINIPLAFQPDEINREGHWLLVLGRLKPGVSIAAANAEMTVIARRRPLRSSIGHSRTATSPMQSRSERSWDSVGRSKRKSSAL
ncbi:MAG: ABC transporter permease, partial [Blastocatellia bacterium]